VNFSTSNGVALGAIGVPGHQATHEADFAKERFRKQKAIFCGRLVRRQDEHLTLAFGHDNRRQQRNQALARARLPRQDANHRHGVAQVALDFLERELLVVL
jgi:hypothetical protein